MPVTGFVSSCLAIAVPAVVGYQGPGNVVAGATAWWGLRAYTAAIATAGTQALVNLRRDSDNATVDILVASNAGFGLTANAVGGASNGVSVTTFKGAANLFVTKVYDQTGGGHDLIQATAANQPALILSGLGSLPVIRLISSTQSIMQTAGNVTVVQPATVSLIFKRTSTFTAINSFFATSAGGFQVGANSVASQAFLYNGAIYAVAATDSIFHAVQFVFISVGGLTVDIDVDGTSNPSGGITQTGSITEALGIGGYTGPVNPCNGDMTEVGVWPVAFSSGQSSSMNSNQHSYWGF